MSGKPLESRFAGSLPRARVIKPQGPRTHAPKQPGHGHKGGMETLQHARRVAKRRVKAKQAKASRKRNR